MSITETGLRVFRGCLFRKTLWEINPSSGYWPARSFAFTAELKSITRLFRMMVLVAEPTTWKACSHRRSEEHTSELQSLMRISYAVFCLKKKIIKQSRTNVNLTIIKSIHQSRIKLIF